MSSKFVKQTMQNVIKLMSEHNKRMHALKKTHPRKRKKSKPLPPPNIEEWDMREFDVSPNTHLLFSVSGAELNTDINGNFYTMLNWLSWPSFICFNRSIDDFIFAERKNLNDLHRNGKVSVRTSSIPMVKISEFEWEDPARRIGSGRTGVQCTIALAPEDVAHLSAEILKLAPKKKYVGVYEKIFFGVVASFAQTPIPAQRKIEPDGVIPDHFEKYANPTEVGVFLMRVNENGKNADNGNFENVLYRISDNFDILKSWKYVYS